MGNENVASVEMVPVSDWLLGLIIGNIGYWQHLIKLIGKRGNSSCGFTFSSVHFHPRGR